MKPTSEQKKGIISTVAVHLLLLLLLFTLALRTPLPRPGEEGVEIRMGDSDIGTLSEPEWVAPASRPVSASPQPAEEEIATQTDEETVAITPRREPAPTPRREQPTPEPARQPQPEPEPEPQPVVDSRAIYTGSNRRDDNGGTGTSGTLGRPDGTSSTGGVGEGGQGSGSGTGTGIGTDGHGTGYFLQGRSKVSLKEPSYNSNEQGRIVVEVLVDRGGNVVQARAGVRIPNTSPVIGSTISDQKLWEQAEKAAMQSKFSKDDKAAERQKGYIVYNFIKLSD